MRVVTKFTHETRGTSYHIWEIYDENDVCVAISGEYFTSHYAASTAANQFMQKIAEVERGK